MMALSLRLSFFTAGFTGLVVMICGSAASRLYADAAYDNQQYWRSRQTLDRDYLDYYSSGNVIYQSAPVTHVVPSFKTVTLALSGESLDTEIRSDEFTVAPYGPSGSINNPEHSLRMTGYRFAPYVAVSLKRIGLGFSAELGKQRYDYRLGIKDQLDNESGVYQKQRSQIDYHAIGVYAYFLPFDSGGQRRIIASMMMGVKDYNVNHKPSGLLDANESFAEHTAKYRYNITNYEVGGLIEFRLLKKFSLVPWVDYIYTDIHDPVDQADAIMNGTTNDMIKGESARFLKADAELMWRSHPRLDFGLDMVIRAFDFAIHLGDAFGLLLNQNRPDTITDHNFVLRLSFDMKAD